MSLYLRLLTYQTEMCFQFLWLYTLGLQQLH